MSDIARNIHGLNVLLFAADGPLLSTDRDANDFISAAWEHQASWVAIPVARLSEDFFRLSTRIAGNVIQKFINYKLSLVVVGDISRWTSESKSLTDFVYEANKGKEIWFVRDIEEFERKLVQ